MIKSVSTIDDLILAIQENNKTGKMEITIKDDANFEYKGEPLVIKSL